MNMTADTMLRDPPLATRDSYHALEREYQALYERLGRPIRASTVAALVTARRSMPPPV